ncbi:hypothetical protein LCGC14_1790670 [marine sediment metagenome]|uniref:Uncharacterized protein n=1 Tax=marine sediment metagenome TaxID=412755 RepID=A0A0F9J7J7_9ZZZZ
MPVNGEENTPLPERIAASGQDLARAASEGDDELLIDLKKFAKKHNWSTVIIAIIAALTAGFGSYKAYQAKTNSNEKAIIQHDNKPMHDDAARKFEIIKVQVVKVESELRGVQVGQATIQEGINELKKEKVDELKKERDFLKRELVRERRKHP